MDIKEPRRRRSLGRPTAGLLRNGRRERVCDYRPVTVRLPPGSRMMLGALTQVLDRPLWRVVNDMIFAYVAGPLRTEQPKWHQEVLAAYEAQRLESRDTVSDFAQQP
jgi:hypothetical protein